MPFLKQLRSKADQVTLEADKVLRINRKQGELGQLRKQIDQQTAHLGALAYGLHKQGEDQAAPLGAVCQQIDGLYVLLRQVEKEIERIRQETLSVEPPVTGERCSECGAVVPDEAVFCPSCGSPRSKLTSVLSCAICGSSLPVDARFCADCGQPVTAPAPLPMPLELPGEVAVPEFPSTATPIEVPDLHEVGTAAPSTVAADLFLPQDAPLSTPISVVCSMCQAEMPAEAAFCPLCGTPTSQS